MRTLAALCIMLSAAAANASTSAESSAISSEKTFFSMPSIAPFKAAAPAVNTGVSAALQDAAFPFQVLEPVIKAAGVMRVRSVVGSVSLPAILDHHRDLLKGKVLGSKPYDISVAGDPGFKKYFLTFSQPNWLGIAPLGDLNRLRGEGIDIQIEPGVVYNFHVSINIFNPVRGSTMEIHATNGTNGPDHDIKTGTILDLVKSHSYIFRARGNEYWLLHGTDVDPNTNQLANTRSLLFIHEAGTSTKAWPVAEASLPVGQPTSVTFGNVQVTMTRSANGQLTISE